MERLKYPCNRCLKRVPLDFKWKGVWPGFVPSIDRLKTIPELVARAPFLLEDWPKSDKVSVCEQCYIYTRGKCSGEADYCIYNKQNRALWYQEPPEGEGYQLWETTTEGSPLSPVFPSLDVLCAWAADNATLFGDFKVSKDVWNKILSKKEQEEND